MNPEPSQLTGTSAVACSAWLDHNGIMVDKHGTAWPYEVTVIQRKDGNGPIPDWDESQCGQHRIEVLESPLAPILNQLPPSDLLRCVATEIHQDNQPLKTYRLRAWYRSQMESETLRFCRQAVLPSISIWSRLASYIRCALWFNEKSSGTREEKP